MKVAGIRAVPVAANFLFDKLPELFLSRDINHIVQHPNQRNTPHSIIPDIHAYKLHPSDRILMTVEHPRQMRQSLKSRLFKRAQHNITIRMCAKTAVERQTHEVNQKSSRAFKQLEVKFAPVTRYCRKWKQWYCDTI
jgi:hypothetical protein